jgi:dipeptidyl-peptidase-4
MSRFLSLALLPAVFAASVFAQTPDYATRTVEFANSGPTGRPPQGGSWSPDGKRLTFMATDASVAGAAGDIVQVDAATGKASVLATRAQLDALTSDAINEKDKDHRERYGMSSFLWAEDSKHLVLDKGGKLWLYSIADGTGTMIVDTGAGSGSDAKFSPDAKSVSYLRGHNLYVHPVGKKDAKETALTANGSDAMLNGEVDWIYLEELDVRSNYFWSPDSAAIAYLQMDEARVPQFPIADWIPTHTGVDMQRYPQPGDPNPLVRVGVVSAKGGATKFIEVPFSAGNDSIPRFGWVDSETVFVEVLTRDNHNENLYFADVKSGKSRLVYSNTDAKYLDENYEITFLPHGQFLAASWRDGHTHLYLYKFEERHPLNADAVLERQLTSGEFEVEGFEGFDEKSGTIFFTSNEGTSLENNLWSEKLDGTGKRKLTSGNGVHHAMVSPDGAHFSDEFSTMTTAPVASVCATGPEQCETFWRSKEIPAATGVTSSVVRLTAADGKTTLYGKLTLPASGAAGSVPLILNPYGGPLPTASIRNDWGGGNLFNELLAQRGFAVLEVDNRGMGGRGREFQQAAYRNFGPVQFSDQMAALDQVLAKYPQLDGKRIGWWGWSWGGSFTLYAMTHTDRIKAGVAVAPVTDFRNYDSIYTERYLGLPAENTAAYDAGADVAAAKDLKGRVLIAHGTGDDNVHLANTIQFVLPLIEAGIPYDLQLFPRKTHSIAGMESRNELFQRILYQFETYLK